MPIDLEGDSSFSCGIAYSQASDSKPPRREGGSTGGAYVLFRNGFVGIALCSSPLRGMAMQPGSPSFIAFAPAPRAGREGKPAQALRRHGTSVGCVRQGSSSRGKVGHRCVSHRRRQHRCGALPGKRWRRRLEGLPPPRSLPAPLPGRTGP